MQLKKRKRVLLLVASNVTKEQARLFITAYNDGNLNEQNEYSCMFGTLYGESSNTPKKVRKLANKVGTPSMCYTGIERAWYNETIFKADCKFLYDLLIDLYLNVT